MPHLRRIIFAIMVTAVIACAQVSLDNQFQVRYASNLNIGDSVVNISNTGARGGVTNTAGTTASIGGSICANVYTFSPDEQMVACCSCPVTPNGLVSLSARQDLTSNTLTPAVPTAVVVKILATVPVGGSCTNSAASVGAPDPATQAPGLVSWGTTIHALPTTPVTYGVTETAFTPATLSESERNKLGSLCGFILANGSGFGVCRSCRLGGLGASTK